MSNNWWLIRSDSQWINLDESEIASSSFFSRDFYLDWTISVLANQNPRYFSREFWLVFYAPLACSISMRAKYPRNNWPGEIAAKDPWVYQTSHDHHQRPRSKTVWLTVHKSEWIIIMNHWMGKSVRIGQELKGLGWMGTFWTDFFELNYWSVFGHFVNRNLHVQKWIFLTSFLKLSTWNQIFTNDILKWLTK